jgi:hypothetical protein
VPVVVDADLDGRLHPGHEATLHFVAAEAPTNVAEYASGLRGLGDRVEALGGRLTLSTSAGTARPYAPAFQPPERTPPDSETGDRAG